MRLGLLGGTFNPVHYGHLRAAEEVREALALDRVLFIPAGLPPLKSGPVVSAAQRLRMCELALQGNPRFELSDLEAQRPGKSYTAETLAVLATKYPGDELVFLLGLDAFLELPAWRDTEALLGGADFAVMARPGYTFSMLASSPYVGVASCIDTGVDHKVLSDLDAGRLTLHQGSVRPGGRKLWLMGLKALPISSTRLRALCAEGRSLKYLLPENVESFIISEGLYNE